MTNAEESRTFLLDNDLVKALASSDLEVRAEAVAQLPEALTRREVDDIAGQVSLVPGNEEVRAGERLEKDVLLYLGVSALNERDDLVTTRSSARELLSRWDIAGYFMLTRRLVKARRMIVDKMTNSSQTGS